MQGKYAGVSEQTFVAILVPRDGRREYERELMCAHEYIHVLRCRGQLLCSELWDGRV
jgi:hypothetical protein